MARTKPEAVPPHMHVPSIMHMGDCLICGNVADSPCHLPPAKIPAAPGKTGDLFRK